MTREHWALFNLVQFDRDYLHPATLHFGRTRSKYWKTLRFCEMLSGYFWLQLGIEVGYFPPNESASAVRQRFGSFLGHFKEEFTSYGYMFPTAFESLIEQGLRHPFAGGFGVDSISPDTAALAAFGSALNSEICLTNNRSGENFVGILNFAPDLIAEVTTADRAVEIAHEQIVDRFVLAKGFSALVEYMEALIRLSETVLAERSIATSQRPSLERRLRHITRWRVNRFRIECETLFFEAGRSLCDSADLDFNAIQPRLKVLLDSWGFTHTKRSLGAGAM